MKKNQELNIVRMDKNILEAIPNPIIIYDADWKVLEANPAALVAFGFADIDELKGKNIGSLVHQDDHQELLFIQHQIKESIQTHPRATLLRTLKNAKAPAAKYRSQFTKMVDYPLKNAVSYMESAISMKETLDYGEKVNPEPENFRILSDNIPGLEMFLVDSNLHVHFKLGRESLNQRWHTASDEGIDFFKYFTPEVISIVHPLLKIAFNQTPISREFSVNNNFFSIRIIPFNQGKAEPLCVVVLQNITDTKLVENKLKLSMHEAEKANRAKDSFVAKMSHEIRTPLNAVLGFTEQLCNTRLTKKQAGYLDVINNSSRHLLTVIDDILILSKIESGTIELDELHFNIPDIFNEIDHLLETKYKKKGLSFQVSVDKFTDTMLLGDVVKLKQVLINLINNAIKFTPKGEVGLKATLVAQEANTKKIRFEVSDTGIGITPNEIKNIFKPFHQVNNLIDRNFSGCGLGLTISKDIVASMGGTLSVDSTPGQGSTFSFTLMLKQAHPDVLKTDANLDESKKSTLKNLRVLFVDDDPVNLLLGKIILEKHKILTDFASSGTQAIKQFSPGKYNFVFLDINMPDISGMDVTQHIREAEMKNKSLQKTIIVAMTANAVKEYLKQYLNAGMDSILLKPYNEEALYQKILRHFPKTPSNPDSEPNYPFPNISNEIFDLTDLLKITRQDHQFTTLMLNTFVDHSKEMLHKIETSLSRDNYEEIGEIAHKLIPSLEQLKINKALDLFKKIETRYLYQSNTKKDKKLIRASIRELNTGIKAVKQTIVRV